MMRRNRLFLFTLAWAVCAIMTIMPARAHAYDITGTYEVSGTTLNIGTWAGDDYTALTIDSGSPPSYAGGTLNMMPAAR